MSTIPPQELTEPAVRELRDRVFDQTSSDHNWDFCREHWMQPAEVRWLSAHDFPVEETHTRTR